MCTHFIEAFLRWNTNIWGNAIGGHLNLWRLLSSHHINRRASHRVHHWCLLLLPLLKHLLRVHLAEVLLERHSRLLHQGRHNPLSLVMLGAWYAMIFILLIWILWWFLRSRIINLIRDTWYHLMKVRVLMLKHLLLHIDGTCHILNLCNREAV